MTSIKQGLVGTVPGRTLERMRELIQLWGVVSLKPEQGGVASADVCARILRSRLCQSDRVYLDIGAHIGSVIAEVRHHDRSIRIIAVEAVPEKAARIARKFPAVAVHQCAVGESTGRVAFFVDVERPGYSAVTRSERASATIREIEVEMKRLDDVVPISATAGFIKIDVEGAELSVLRGAALLVERCRPIILFESGLGTGHSPEESRRALYLWFEERQYLILVPNRVAHDGPALSCEGFLESHFYPRRTANYFAVPAERRLEVRDLARAVMHVCVSG